MFVNGLFLRNIWKSVVLGKSKEDEEERLLYASVSASYLHELFYSELICVCVRGETRWELSMEPNSWFLDAINGPADCLQA